MNTKIFLTTLFGVWLSINPASAQPSKLELAKKNFEDTCIRGFPEAVMNPLKVQQHTFKLLTSENFIYGKETAQLSDQQTISIKDQGCEWYSWEIELVINATLLEKNNKFCDQCLIKQLEQYSILFKPDNKEFYTDSIKPLIKRVQQQKKLKIGTAYDVDPDSEISYTTTIDTLKKLDKQHYKIGLIFSAEL
ncbi:hypothetical protein BKE30_02835 [Alkanindiges hydrocarboniclasticus]|uniref:Uncharacterized protein n=1 Tax=Alkanindiges hydrocarboniclasticus TaxID=1907941 RepID=A0A1S8CWT6_9GAMM|nr:hypothetical protein [Alkanindiges hydrocarboniclasticus]ONG41789.1 hypothetical protein BKE30_02835 [Alkanindiges hydrocarboniclasticus]